MSPQSSTTPGQRALRKQMREQRRQLDHGFQRDAAQSVRRHMARSLRFSRARTVAFYAASGGEIDLWPLLLAAAASGKRCCLPVMTDRLVRFESSPLWFQRFDPMRQPLVQGRWGMMEPAYAPGDRIRLEQLDVIFVPLVAFDRQGHRIGMGQGFYDRALATAGRRFRRPWLVGCGYSLQEVERIPANPWDVPLDAVVTEEGLMACRRRVPEA